MMRHSTLEDWLRWQEQLHPAAIALGLDRVRRVWRAMGAPAPAGTVITVAGTNGKGSSVAMLEAILGAAGYRVGAYTSPHLLRYNERVRIQGADASSEDLCAAFARVDRARGDISLTYFEFGTLAALDLFARAQLDVVVLEVGMGGRLDAVNIIDADVALITNIGVDHTEWLGADREAIGREKAGILRAGRPAVVAEPQPPRSVLDAAAALGAPLAIAGRDYDYRVVDGGWRWHGHHRQFAGLPRPALAGPHQLCNAAGVLMVLTLLAPRVPVGQGDVAAGLSAVRLPGRFQALDARGARIVDVAHNPHGAAVLAEALRSRPCAGETHMVLAMLADKDAAGVVNALAQTVQVWHIAGLTVARGASAEQLAARMPAVAAIHRYADVAAAYRGACGMAGAQDRVVVCGSFYTVAEVLRQAHEGIWNEWH